jgi:hypothetical protein
MQNLDSAILALLLKKNVKMLEDKYLPVLRQQSLENDPNLSADFLNGLTNEISLMNEAVKKATLGKRPILLNSPQDMFPDS